MIGTEAFDKMNISWLRGGEPGVPSSDVRFLLAAVDIARGRVLEARAHLDVIDGFKSTLATNRSDLLLKYRAAADFMDPNVDRLDVAYPFETIDRIEAAKDLRTRETTSGPTAELLAALPPLDGRRLSTTWGESFTSVDLRVLETWFDSAAGLQPGNFTHVNPHRLPLSEYDASRTGRALNRAREDVRKGDLAAAMAEVDIVDARYRDTIDRTPEELLTYRRSVEDIKDMMNVLGRRFVGADEPFYKEPVRDFFGTEFFAGNRHYDELPTPVASYAAGLNNLIESSLNRGTAGTLYQRANDLMNAIFEGQGRTPRAARSFFTELQAVRTANRAPQLPNDVVNAYTTDARRLSNLYEDGANAGWVDPNHQVVPDDVIEGFTGPAKNAYEIVADPKTEVRLQVGYYRRDLWAATARAIVRVQDGEDAQQGYDELIRPMLAFKRQQVAPQRDVFNQHGRDYDRRNLLQELLRVTP